MIRCVIIDDEEPARALIELHLSVLKEFEILGSFDNALDAFHFLQTATVDLLFVDIHMPRVNGLQMIRSLKVCPKIILTTAYREYAVEAFELDALDYLVKPITQERFLKAVAKFHYNQRDVSEKPPAQTDFDTAYIFLKVGKGEVRILLRDILYIEGLKDYTKIHLTDKFLVASERISYMEDKLPENKFARVHKSYLVALEKVTGVYADYLLLEEIRLPLGRVYKNEFLKKIKPALQKS